MSVYTPVSHAELAAFLYHYPLGELVSYQGISAGIENTNYFVNTQPLNAPSAHPQTHTTTTQHTSAAKQTERTPTEPTQWVLTLFEKHNTEDLVFFMALIQHLCAANIPTAQPLAQKSGAILGKLNGKDATLVTRLNGKTLDKQTPSVQQCAAIGKALAQVHVAVKSFPLQRNADCGTVWRQQTGVKMLTYLAPADHALLNNELAYQAAFQQSATCQQLPRGIIHADLFRDNAMFDGEELTGIIDWYYAATGHYLFDLATVVNDWCYVTDASTNTIRLESNKLYALLHAYHTIQPLTANDQLCWQAMLRAAALRFWLSRLVDFHFPRAGELTQTKDPNEFKHKLLLTIENTAQLTDVWDTLN
ncbi:MAG: homoserine kinase [bacterium]